MPTNPSNHLRPSPMAVAVDHRHGFKPPIWTRRCRLRSFPHADAALLDPDPPSSALPLMPSPNLPRSVSTPCLSSATATAGPDEPADHIARIEIVGGHRACGVHALVVEAAIAMASGTQPVPVSNGLSGAYYLRNRSGESFAILKPIDEEPLPIGILGRPGSRHSVRASGTGVREVAAYLLDHGSFSGVPPTALIKISHPTFTSATNSPAAARKTASIQRFVPHDFDAGELGPSRFSVPSVHRIGILDIRLLNIDRHAGNILVKKRLTSSNGSFDGYDGYKNDSGTELVPIDHGLCLPEILDDPYFEWLHWPQAAVPFSEHEVEYISALDPFRDAELLRAELPSLRESAIRILVLCTIFLKRALAAGLCLADIGDMMTREFSGFEEEPSMLETLCKQAEDSMNNITLSSDDGDDEEVVFEGNESKQYQFEIECDDDGGFSESSNVVDIPLLLQSKVAKEDANADRNRKVLVPVHEDDGDDEEGDGCTKLGVIAKSISFSAAGFNYEGVGGSGSKSISFQGLSGEEWGSFLERFEQLLPDAFEARKSMGLKQQRLGTSCKF
uniref:1-phosphatidylinositol 4-kinase n=1 Tax=Elaeis guineensis var. tenera TaxID=51953 RepID=A0A6I9SFY7_ELAGV|nr:phosphatidylinositol 4-kinase gamma 8-like [Elaeis guineensis]XP_029124130.1 phosphatidylinositol 4-kinase gamma 8-like [Elaeis guineensis]XP_029124131.1 phosphatidylinositol 4-kinase gamma 8-like [Elaeis guineensis]